MLTILHVVLFTPIHSTICGEEGLVPCIRTILTTYVATERTSAVSFPATNNDITETSSKSDNLDSVNLVLRTVNKGNVSPLCVYRLDRKFLKGTEVFLPYKPHSYNIFIWPAKEHSRLLDSVNSQLSVFCSEIYFNPRARFFIVATGHCPKNY